MTPYVVYGIPDEQWIAAAAASTSLKEAVGIVDVAKYPAWHHLTTKHRADLVSAMRLVLGRERPLRVCRTGCGHPARSQVLQTGPRLCSTCYQRQLRGGEAGPANDRARARGQECTIEGCTDEQYAKQMCNLHWQRVRLWGYPGGPGRMRRNWWLAGFSADDMRACKEFVYGKREDRPLTDEGIRLRIDYEAIIKNDPCVYCGEPGGEVEHVEPLALGGSSEWDNLAGACRSCNSSKHATPLLMYLLAKQRR